MSHLLSLNAGLAKAPIMPRFILQMLNKCRLNKKVDWSNQAQYPYICLELNLARERNHTLATCADFESYLTSP